MPEPYDRRPMSRPDRNTEGRGYQNRQSHSETVSLPTPRIIAYYKDSNNKALDPDLLDQKASEWAKDFANLKTAQMRRFYDDLKAIERKIMIGKSTEDQEENFKRDRALIVMFKAKSVYAEKRKVAPREFTQFIFDHVASIKCLSDFQAFIKVFEAVVAFHKFYSPEKG